MAKSYDRRKSTNEEDRLKSPIDHSQNGIEAHFKSKSMNTRSKQAKKNESDNMTSDSDSSEDLSNDEGRKQSPVKANGDDGSASDGTPPAADSSTDYLAKLFQPSDNDELNPSNPFGIDWKDTFKKSVEKRTLPKQGSSIYIEKQIMMPVLVTAEGDSFYTCEENNRTANALFKKALALRREETDKDSNYNKDKEPFLRVYLQGVYQLGELGNYDVKQYENPLPGDFYREKEAAWNLIRGFVSEPPKQNLVISIIIRYFCEIRLGINNGIPPKGKNIMIPMNEQIALLNSIEIYFGTLGNDFKSSNGIEWMMPLAHMVNESIREFVPRIPQIQFDIESLLESIKAKSPYTKESWIYEPDECIERYKGFVDTWTEQKKSLIQSIETFNEHNPHATISLKEHGVVSTQHDTEEFIVEREAMRDDPNRIRGKVHDFEHNYIPKDELLHQLALDETKKQIPPHQIVNRHIETRKEVRDAMWDFLQERNDPEYSYDDSTWKFIKGVVPYLTEKPSGSSNVAAAPPAQQQSEAARPNLTNSLCGPAASSERTAPSSGTKRPRSQPNARISNVMGRKPKKPK